MKDRRKEFRVRGPVRCVRSEVSEFEKVNGQWVEKLPWLGQSVTFDAAGQVIEQEHRNPDGSVWRTLHHFAEDGRPLSTESFDPEGKPVRRITFVYDEAGRLIAERSEGGEEMVALEQTRYHYDENNQKVSEQLLEPLDAAESSATLIGIEGTDFSLTLQDAHRIVTYFDEQERPHTIKIENRDGRLASRVEILRDEEGRPLAEVQYLGETPPFSQMCEVAPASGAGTEGPDDEQLAEAAREMERLFAPGTAFMRQTHAYDERGNLVEKKMTMAGLTAFHQIFTYNERGDVSEEIGYEPGGAVQRRALYEREYDGRGNWVVEKIWTGPVGDDSSELSPSVIYRRTITYQE